MNKMLTSYTSNSHPWWHMINEDFPEKVPGVVGIYNGFAPTLFISDVEMINELYVTKNKYFDKEKQIVQFFIP